MYLIYTPDDGDEQRWRYDPNKLLSVEREDLERRTGRDFTDFTTAVLSGNSLCRRALLFMFLRRAHRTLRWDDVDFTWEQLKLEYSRQEFALMREAIAGDSSITAAERTARLDAIDLEMATAIDEEDLEGKARLPIAG